MQHFLCFNQLESDCKKSVSEKHLDHGPAGVDDVLHNDNVSSVQLLDVLNPLDANRAGRPGFYLYEV